MRLGILTDSHGRAEALREGIQALRARGVDRLIHLGDVADTLRPETLDECVGILIENDINGVLGNHEYSFVTHFFKRYPERFSEAAMEYLRALPYVIETPQACFTHFSPEGGVHGLYSHTDEASYKAILLNSEWPVLINGHSHEPRIYRQLDGAIENVGFSIDAPFALRADARYVFTCGALEDRWCAVFDVDGRVFEIVRLEG